MTFHNDSLHQMQGVDEYKVRICEEKRERSQNGIEWDEVELRELACALQY